MRCLRTILASVALCSAGCNEFGQPIWEAAPFDPGVAAPHVSSDGATVVSSAQARTLTGTVSGRGAYELFDVGPCSFGDEWTVSWSGAPFAATPFIVTLFDHNHELLSRSIVSAGGELRHIMRTDVPAAFIGIATANGSNGGTFSFGARKRPGVAVPAPRGQLVWLNFGQGRDVRVHGRPGIEFSAFDGAHIGGRYLGHTTTIKDEIVNQMRNDYAAFEVTILTSDEGPPPAEPHSVIHFGGDDSGLLGLADNVDLYNANPVQTAVIYVDAFGAYNTMQLEPAELAVMIANVASHELGHLLGLYHTQNPDDVMDTTGSAWDLAGVQWFGSVALESTVFPIGFENSPVRLNETVGARPAAPEADAATAGKAAALKPQIRELIRSFTREELRHACGICVDLDGCGEAPPE
jgi:hypothetical protein